MTHGSMVDFQTARATIRANANRLFPKAVGDGRSASERIRTGGSPIIYHDPKFKFSKQSKFFTIGSCFARNVEAILKRMDVPVLTMNQPIPDEFYGLTGLGGRTGALNAYTPDAILDMIRISRRPDRNTIGRVHFADDAYMDMLISGVRQSNSEEFDFVRTLIMETYDKLPMADVVIITLGYTEAWFYKPDQVFVNRPPGGNRALMLKGDDFCFSNRTPNQVVEALGKTIALIRELTADRAKIILTVSPVPMNGTWTSKDVLVANSYSKATLLSAAVSLAESYDFVDYYPSYEMVTMSPIDLTWEDDGLHVKSSRVEEVIKTFSDLYFE